MIGVPPETAAAYILAMARRHAENCATAKFHGDGVPYSPPVPLEVATVLAEAYAEVDALTARLARYRGALAEIVRLEDVEVGTEGPWWGREWDVARDVARALLAEEEQRAEDAECRAIIAAMHAKGEL